MLSNSGMDEHGGSSGGQAGDQSHKEWCLVPWYQYAPGGWQYMIRYPDPMVGQLLSDLACEAAANDLIGYDQDERTTFWTQLQRAGYRPNQITVACEADCSAGVAAIVKAAGYLLGNAAMKEISPDNYTGSIRAALQGAGFEIFSDPKYLTSDAYLLPGDFLLREGWHITTNVTAGSETGEDDTVISEIMKAARFEFFNGGQKIYRVTADELNVRLAPSVNAPIHPYWSKLSSGNLVRAFGETTDGTWTAIGISAGAGTGTIGFVWSDYITKV